MKQYALLSMLMMVGTAVSGQLVAIREMKDPVEGICDNSKVYALLIFQGQEEQKCSMVKEEVEERLNQDVDYLRNNPKFKLKKHESVTTMVNCTSELVAVELDTKSPEFNQQVCDVFRTLNATWEAGRINGKPVDSVHLWGIEIRKGRIILR